MDKFLKKCLDKKNAARAAIGTAVATAAGQVLAAVDVSAVEAKIAAAEASAGTVGTYVIGAVAGLVVIGLIIGIVRKL